MTVTKRTYESVDEGLTWTLVPLGTLSPTYADPEQVDAAFLANYMAAAITRDVFCPSEAKPTAPQVGYTPS